MCSRCLAISECGMCVDRHDQPLGPLTHAVHSPASPSLPPPLESIALHPFPSPSLTSPDASPWQVASSFSRLMTGAFFSLDLSCDAVPQGNISHKGGRPRQALRHKGTTLDHSLQMCRPPNGVLLMRFPLKKFLYGGSRHSSDWIKVVCSNMVTWHQNQGYISSWRSCFTNVTYNRSHRYVCLTNFKLCSKQELLIKMNSLITYTYLSIHNHH